MHCAQLTVAIILCGPSVPSYARSTTTGKRRTGTTADPLMMTGQCLADGCDRDAKHSGNPARTTTEGYCRLHFMRIQKHGDPDHEYKGEKTYIWTGDSATSGAIHQRVYKSKGKASEHNCVDCGKRARHWSYDRTDPNQKIDPKRGPYSLNMDCYHPRCVRCHKNFDMAHVMRERGQAS